MQTSGKHLVPVFLALLLPLMGGWQTDPEPEHAPVSKAEILTTMKRATQFMDDKVSYQGGYVWSYLPDLSRRWGEMEAKKTMIWVQPPGTATMGHLFLDAYHATGDSYYYRVAKRATEVLMRAQHPSGGWNYMADLAGEASLQEWYRTIGANGWRLEEFQHYYGNATFDDAGTAEASKLLLRMYLEKREPAIKKALDKAIAFVKESQYDMGGWPQRYPPAGAFTKQGHADYSSYITFNDDVAQENIEFLVLCYQALGDTSLLDPIRRAMDSFLVTQLPAPQPGWALQYTTDLQPAGARTYEPKALSTATTVNNVRQLMNFYRLMGDRKYLARIPEALDWLEALRLPDDAIVDNRTHPMFIELGTNKALYLHRRGSNVVNGAYYADYDPTHTIAHYRSTRFVDVADLRTQFEAIRQLSPEEATAKSPLKSGVKVELPRYFTLRGAKISDLNSRGLSRRAASTEEVQQLISTLTPDGYWLTPLRVTTHPYIGPGTTEVAEGDFRSQFVGDQYDTSPYYTDQAQEGISTGAFVRNMDVLIEYLTAHDQAVSQQGD
ncbi:pectate lyase, PelA/Pel-15E family [Catalinimonas alkaloidigena]|uniref:Pectate lyase, PelA/Pel-15E family n=1 Tax=Catalinimonas alkaloidigena TaxID=1075417 RepID=A0A1G9PFY7_9BACT|nr:pectate lyase [Catalinimonas alkaloidigena]SDL97649.1 pectate lyase, PelA/Pel-15E family [Catalinimonas alkaloidigena]